MNRRKASVAAVVTTAALVATPTLASTANAELSPTNVLNVLGIPLQNANQVIQAGNVKTGDTKDGKDVITNLPNAIFAALVNQGAVGDTAELQKRLTSYFNQSTTNFGKLPSDIVSYDTAAISKLFAPAPLAANVATVKAVNAPVTSAAPSPLDLLGLPLQLATNALQAFNVELRDASGNVIVTDGSTTKTNVANAIFKAVVDLGATGKWGALANNIGLYLAHFGTNVASGKFVSQKPTVAPAASGVTSAQALTVAAKTTASETSPADAGLVGDLFNVAGIPLNNANQAIQSFVVVIGKDKDGNDIKTNVVNAVFKAVVELGFTGQWGKLADAVTGYVATTAKQVSELPGKVLAYDTQAITNVFNGGLAPAPSAQTTATPGGSVSTAGKALSLPAAAATGSGSDGNLGTGSQAAAAAATADAPTAPAAPTSGGSSKGKGVDLFEKFAEAVGGGKNGPTTGAGSTGGGTTGGGTTGAGSTGAGSTGGGTTGAGSTGGGTTGAGSTGGDSTGGGTSGDAGGAK